MLRSICRISYIALPLALGLGASPSMARVGYYRSPDIQGDTVVFSCEGDLWAVPADGGDARRLTTWPGTEGTPRISPDGRWIAFSGTYDGNRDVYIIPFGGGEPRRLTWHPAVDEPIAWTHDSTTLYFSSRREHPHGDAELYTISPEGGDPSKVPIGPVATLGIEPETGTFAFTRTRGGGTWKRYRGGTAADIWVGDPSGGSFRQITHFAGMDAHPMWFAGRIYFFSDQGGTVNLWSMQPDGEGRTQHTDFQSWDARFPSMDARGRIVFGLAGDLQIHDLNSGRTTPLEIELPSERLLTRTRYPDAVQYLTDFALAPDGERLAISTRGEIFSVAVKDGVTLPVTRGSGARETRISYDRKGEKLYFITDASGEEMIASADAWGRDTPETYSSAPGSSWHFRPVPSPDGRWIAYSDQSQTLFVRPIGGGDARRVDQSELAEITDYAWSPDGRWLAYSKQNSVEFGSIHIYDVKDGSVHAVTGEYTNDHSPCWDPDGRYLYFLSDRTVNPAIGWSDFETIHIKPIRPYLLLLRDDVHNPFLRDAGAPPGTGTPREEDEDGYDGRDGDGSGRDGDRRDRFDGGDRRDRSDGGDREGARRDRAGRDDRSENRGSDPDAPIVPIEIDFDGLAARVEELPVAAGNYFRPSATRHALFYISTPVQGLSEEEPEEWGDEPDQPSGVLMMFDLKRKKVETFLEGVSAYDLQPRRERIAVMKQRGRIYVLDTHGPPRAEELEEKRVSLDDVVVELDPREEWRQMYLEAWRNMRDFYWDPSMHGVDWAAVRDQYIALLPRITTQGELQDLIAETIGELSNSHTYVWGGDPGVIVPERPVGLLGAVLRREGRAFRVERIYRGDDADRIRSALSEPGAMVREGEYILAINHEPVREGEPLEAMLENRAGQEILLTVNTRPQDSGARRVVVRAMTEARERALRYADWVRQNREYVLRQTGGRIGYVHIPDMGSRGLREFQTWFHPQLSREGMVVDARWNGGGFVSQLVVSRLLRQILIWDRARWGGVYTYPSRVLNGPFVVLTNEHAGSDGDLFAAAIQTAGAAPIIGKRSWGGVVGIRGDKPLQDLGMVTHPEYAWWQSRNGWGLENHGVDPDIVVENLPQDVGRGVDAQLDRAIQEVLKRHAEKPPQRPVFGPAPDHSREAFRRER